jgi:glucan endo-1,3-alpha-glucosidase
MLICASLPCATSISSRAANSLTSQHTELKRVFAHYMVAWPRGGPQASVESYQAEIRDAQARGIDGFALNCGGWERSEPHYKRRVLRMFEAADRLGSGFRLFVSADGRAQEEIADIVATTRGLKAQLMVNGAPVLSAYAAGGNGFADGAALISHARELGVFFVPHFFPSTGERQITSVEASEIVRRLDDAGGYFYFGAAGAPSLIAKSTQALGAALKARRKLFMAPVTPYYCGLAAGTNYRAFETDGLSGMAAEWEATVASDATWVQIVTWNDWAESTYVAPIGDSGRARIYDDRFGDLLSHAGYLDASAYYIKWFKTGVKPEITKDRLFYFYRLQGPGSIRLNAPATRDAGLPPRSNTSLSSRIHVSLFLTAPAVLSVMLAGSVQVVDVPRGITHVSVDSGIGTPRFMVHRQGKLLIDKTGEQAITVSDVSSRYNYFSGSATAGELG